MNMNKHQNKHQKVFYFNPTLLSDLWLRLEGIPANNFWFPERSGNVSFWFPERSQERSLLGSQESFLT